jgi:flavin reductase (DIM6/NTAB) family NADH-FMN oxidoreductase RutF
MKIEVSKQKATRLINCSPVILVTAGFEGKVNITTCAWSMPLSQAPATVAIALAKKHFSSELIKKSSEFIINIPDFKLQDKVMSCGSASGRDRDKFKESGLSAGKACFLKNTPKIAECCAAIECSLTDTKEVSDHYLFFGEAIYAEAEHDLFVNDFWDTNKAELIFHLGSKFFFKPSPYTVFKK